MALYGYPIWNGSILIAGADSIDEFNLLVEETFAESYQPDGFVYYFGKSKDDCPFSQEIDADHYIIVMALDTFSPIESVKFLCSAYNIFLVDSFTELQRKANELKTAEMANDEDMSADDLIRLGKI